MRRTSTSDERTATVDGWFRIAPSSSPSPCQSASNNAHPLTPPRSGRHVRPQPPRRADASSHGPDALGLARAADPMRMLLRETRVKDKMLRAGAAASSSGATPSIAGPPTAVAPAAALRRIDHARERATQPPVRSSSRHLKLLEAHVATPSASNSPRADDRHAVAEAFSPQRSLRLTRLHRPPAQAPTPHPTPSPSPAPARSSVRADLQSLERPVSLPLHQLIQTVDDAVDADPRAVSSETALTHAFMAEWLAHYDATRQTFKSVVVHAEVGFHELNRLTANVPRPNEFATAFAFKVLRDLAPHFGPYAALLDVVCAELQLAAYAQAHALPYFALVKHQKQLVLALRRDKARRHERNDFLAREIVQVHRMFHHFLDACSSGLVRTLFREWYSIAVIRKKNSKKYIEYFSAWFTGSAKALVPKLFATWKHATGQRKIDRMQTQLRLDGETLAALQRQVDELSVQRDVAQVESLAIRNDRKHAEDMIQRLNRKIQSASAYVDGSYRRESIVCQEGQLRVEAVSVLPSLVLESLLRAYHNVGFLQQLHHEFVPKHAVASATAAASTAPAQVPGRSVDSDSAPSRAGATSAPLKALDALAGKPTVLQECLAEILKLRAASALLPPGAQSIALTEPSLQRFAELFQSIQHRMDAKHVHVIFTHVAPTIKTDAASSAIAEADERDDSDGDAGERLDSEYAHSRADSVAHLYEQTLDAIRAQDEHYARNAKLFSARLLESHEVSVVPTHYVLTARSALATSTSGLGSSLETPSALDASAPAAAPSMAMLQSGDLGVINGARRFSLANVCPIKMTALHFARPPSKASSSRDASCASTPSNAALERLELMRGSDLTLSPRHARAFFVLFLAHVASEYGSLLFSPADMSAFVHTAYAADASETTAPSPGVQPARRAALPTVTESSPAAAAHAVDSDDDQGFSHLVTAYTVWNRLAGQMIDAEIVQSRGGAALALVDRPNTAEIVEAAARRASQTNGTSALGVRPKLQFHIEPLPHGILMTSAAKERESSSASSSPARLSLSLGETFHTARIRKLSLDDTVTLTQCLAHVQRVVATTTTRSQDFSVVRQQLREFRHVQWEQASELASQFASASAPSSSTAPASGVTPVFSSSHARDERLHVFECVTFENPVIERIFSVEDSPSDELVRVRATLERAKHAVRHLYTKHRPQLTHAVTLDDLWHVVKLLRLPKEIHMLPAMRDDDVAGATSGIEQRFSPDDLAEILLQLCNEQFLPHVTPLSARVEVLVKHHLPFAAQHQSILRDVLHHADVKRALSDHAQTLRIIFRRYCAKERDVSHGAQQHQALHHSVLSGGGGTSKSGHSQQQRPVRRTGHGITKYMRLIDWLAFIQDYNLLRPRFPLDYAVLVFRNVQEVASSSSTDDADEQQQQQLEMIYSEFCEALVSVAACYFPDPFLKSATKVNQFIQRFLPVSPEEVSSHAMA